VRAVCVQCACSVRASVRAVCVPVCVQCACQRCGHLLDVAYPARQEGALLHAPPSVELLGALLQLGLRDRATCRLRQPGEVVGVALHLCRKQGLCRACVGPVWPASAAQLADWPRLAEAWGSLRHELALEAASGESAG